MYLIQQKQLQKAQKGLQFVFGATVTNPEEKPIHRALVHKVFQLQPSKGGK
jgi:hypothetical protein